MSVNYSKTRLRGPILALDLGGTNARAAVVTPAGEVTGRRSGSTPMRDGMHAVIDYCLELLRAARIFDVYAGERIEAGKRSLALRLEFGAADRTLTDAEVAERREAIVAALAEIGGSLRG